MRTCMALFLGLSVSSCYLPLVLGCFWSKSFLTDLSKKKWPRRYGAICLLFLFQLRLHFLDIEDARDLFPLQLSEASQLHINLFREFLAYFF